MRTKLLFAATAKSSIDRARLKHQWAADGRLPHSGRVSQIALDSCIQRFGNPHARFKNTVTGIDFDKATAELPILRDFIDFVNKQSSVYMDCLNGFEGNTVRIERHVARVTFPARKELRNGKEVVIWDSMEDPSQPDVIHSSIRKSSTYFADNAEAGFNEQQICWAIIVFIFAYWDEEIRPAIAKVRGVKTNDIKIDALGDLRTLRKAVVHSNGIVTASEHDKLKKMADLTKPGEKLVLNHDQMHKVFVLVKNAIGEIMLHYTGDLPGAPSPDDIVDIAIQNVRPRGRRDP